MTASKVVVLGDACVDMVIQLPTRPRQGTPDLTKAIPQLYGGGSAANVAVTLARLGVDAAMMGAVGDDGYGRWVRADLVGEGVDVTGLAVAHEAFTSMVMALIEPDGERLIVAWPPERGAHLCLDMDAIDPSLIASASWLHTTGMCLRASPASDTVLLAMKLAREAGVPVSLDLNLRAESWGLDDATQTTFRRAIDLSDVVLGNAQEEIMPMARGSSVVEGSKTLCGGKRIVIARQGANGALVTTPTAVFQVPAFKTEVVDTLGAGDAFDGGFIAARLANLDIREAIRWGHAAASIQITHAGARSLPSVKDLKQVLALMGGD